MAEIEDLRSLSLAAVGELDLLREQGEILEIILEGLTSPSERTLRRTELLLECYLSKAEYHFDELKTYLNSIRSLSSAVSDDDPLNF